ncbi:hypothetical protein B6T47_23520 [Salmonella enterica]|nr:hypothetical protein [Salmonella enterica]
MINRLGVGVVDSSKLITLMKKGIENTTYVDKSLNDVVKSSLSVDGNGDINATFGSGDRPGAWTFDGIDLNATRNINLSGIGLTNSMLQAGGGLTINDGNSLLNLSGSNMTAGQNISLTGNGGITLTKSDIAAGNDITMLASNGTVSISSSNINASNGSVLLQSGRTIGVLNGTKICAANNLSVLIKSKEFINNYIFTVSNSSLQSGKKLNVSVDGNTSNYNALLFLSNAKFDGENININVTGKGGGAEIYYTNTFNGTLTLSAKTNSSYDDGAPANIFLGGGSSIIVNGDANISSTVNGMGGRGAALDLHGGISVTGNLSLSGESEDNSAGIFTVGDRKEIKAGGQVILNGKSNGGTAVQVTSGAIVGNSVVINGTSSSGGTGVYVSDGAVLSNATVTGTTDTGSGIHVGGNLTNSNTTLAGVASGQGAGVEIGGNISGGMVTGQSATGDGVLVSGAETTVSNATVTGNTTTGTGVTISGNLTNAGSTSISGSATGNGTGVALNGTLNGTVSGTSDGGVGAHISDGAIITDGSRVSGSSAQGSGTVVSGGITNDGSIAGNSTNGDGLVLNSTVAGGGSFSGVSTNGAGAHITGDTHLAGGSLSGTTTNGSGMLLDGTLTHSADASISTTVTPGGNGQEITGSGTETPPDITPPDVTPPVDSTVQRYRLLSRQSVISQVPHARPLTQSAGYQAAPQPLDISLCSGEGPCRSLTVNQTLTATPQAGKATSGPEKAAP